MADDPKPAAAHFVSLAWPIVSVFAILVFIGPLTRLAESLSYRADDVVSVRLGELEITYNIDELPIPSDAVAAALDSGLSELEVLTLMEYDPHNDNSELGGGACFSNLDTDNRFTVLSSLSEDNLVNLVEQQPEHDWCPNPYAVSLTPLGASVKQFMGSLISVQLD